MSIELLINSFWLLSILTAIFNITKKKYLQKKYFYFINMAFRLCFTVSIALMILGFYLMVLKL